MSLRWCAGVGVRDWTGLPSGSTQTSWTLLINDRIQPMETGSDHTGAEASANRARQAHSNCIRLQRFWKNAHNVLLREDQRNQRETSALTLIKSLGWSSLGRLYSSTLLPSDLIQRAGDTFSPETRSQKPHQHPEWALKKKTKRPCSSSMRDKPSSRCERKLLQW